MTSFDHVVVGSGIAGLLAAILLKTNQPNASVCIIEAAPDCGGLLRSIKTPQGYEFDYGTHILGETGIAALDAIVMPPMPNSDWSTLPILKPGNVVNGFYYQFSQLLYACALPGDVLEKATYQLLSAPHSEATNASNLEQYCLAMYGQTFTERLFAPLMKKLMNAELKDLHPTSLALFGYDRLIIGPGEMMRELKQIPHFDNILAFETYNEGVSSLNNYYPKHGKGVGLWVDMLVENAKKLGVEILTSTNIEKIERSGDTILNLQTNNKEYALMSVDELIWTAPLFPLIKSANLDFKPQYKPDICQIVLHNFVFDQAFDTHNFHVYCNDPAMDSFRITLYSNIAEEGEINGEHRCTVEVLSDAQKQYSPAQLTTMENAIIDELKTIGVITPDTQAIYQNTVLTNNGFPVYTSKFVEELGRQRDCVQSQLSNIRLLGKASANSFFMADVLREVYHAFTNENKSE